MPNGVPGRRRLLVVTGGLVVAAIALSSLLSVNTFPMIANDSVVYLEHSLDLSESGWVTDGFRQAGYPVTIAVVRWVADVVGAEPLLAMALLQRLLMVIAGVLAFWLWRWWALPLLALLAAESTIAYSNFLLTEGIGLPISLLLVFPTVIYLSSVVSQEDHLPSRGIMLLGGLAALGALYLYTLRSTYGVFGVVPLAMAAASWKTRYRGFSLALLGGFILLAGSFTLMVSLDNEGEFGVVSPTLGGDPTRYYYAWNQVFTVHPENQHDLELAEFYDDGFVHHFSREVSVTGLPYEDQVVLYDREIESMLQAAGLSVVGSQVQSALWSLAGGRLHDVAGAVSLVSSSTRADVDQVVHLNSFAQENGAEAFSDVYNDSQTPEVVITDPIGIPLSIDSQDVVAFLLPIAFGVMVAGLFVAELRYMALTGLGVVLATAVGVGLIRADNFRFLIASSVFGVGVATAAIHRYRAGHDGRRW